MGPCVPISGWHAGTLASLLISNTGRSSPLFAPSTVTHDGDTTHIDVLVRDSEVAVLPRDDPVRCSKQLLLAIAPSSYPRSLAPPFPARCFYSAGQSRRRNSSAITGYQVHAD